MNQLAYYQVTGSHLSSTLALTVADCARMTLISSSSTEARFQCMPSVTAETKAITVKDQSGGTTLYSNSTSVLAATSPLPVPTYGFNLGNSLEANWGMAVPGPAVYPSAAKAGFNAVRIPCMWDTKADPVTHKIDPAYMATVKQAVDRSLAAGMHVLINVHWDGGWLDSHIDNYDDDSHPSQAVRDAKNAAMRIVVDAKVRSYWTQIATTFAGYDNRLLFAAANEPDVKSLAAMNTLMGYYQTFVNTVRAAGGKNTNRWLVLQGSGDTSWLNTLPTDSTPGRLMVEYHNYTPSNFTISHTDPGAIYYWGPAYHYAQDAIHNATWGEEGVIDSGFQQLKEQYVDKGIPVMVGEFQAAGASLKGIPGDYNNASTLYWNKYLVDSALGHGLSPFYWSTPDAPFVYDTGAITNSDVVGVLTGHTAAPPPPNGAPYAVTGLAATNTGTGRIDLAWNAVAGATSYSLYRAAESGYESDGAPVITGITGTSYVDSGLNDGTTYYYQIVAVNSSGQSGFTTEARASTPGTNPDATKFNFETDTQRWSTDGALITGIATSSAQHFAGKQSLAVNFVGGAAGDSSVVVSDLVVPAGATLTFHIWVPVGHQVTSIVPILQDFNWVWTQGWWGNLTAGAWNTRTYTMPSSGTSPLKHLTLKISTGAAWTGTLYIDSINWTAP